MKERRTAMRLLAPGVALMVATAASLSAQEVTGRLEGRVLTPDGTPIAQVELTVSSPSLLGHRTATTNQRGRFLVSALPVGTYRVQVRRIGFRPLAIEPVPVRLGETTSLPRVTLEPSAVQLPEVTVTAAAVGFDPRNTAQRIILDASRLDALPLERNFREIMLLASSAIPSFLGTGGAGAGVNRDGINVAGATGYENTFFVDGINITSPIRGETSIDLPYNFIQQIEVKTGGSTADDAQALGGVVNVVTPSGGNRLHGQVFGFFSNDGLETGARPVNGFYQTGFTFYDAGASLSGPIVRDRLWFFAAYDESHERRDHTYSFGALADTKQQHLFAGKLTWQASPRTSAVFTILGDPSRSEPLAGPLFGNGVPQNAEVLQRKDKAGGVGLSLRGQHQLSPGILIEASVSQMTRLETGEPATPAGHAPVVIDQLNGTLYGGHGLAYRFDSRRRSARADVSWQLGSHALKAGALYEVLYGDITIDIDRNSAGGTITRVATDQYDWHWNLQKNGRGHNRNPSLYAQDSWQLSPWLLLNAGVRWSVQDLSDAGNKSTYSEFRVHDGVQPRIGIVYQLGRLGTQRAFASYSRSVEQLPTWGHQNFAAGAESLMVFPRDPRADTTGGVVDQSGPNGAGNPVEPGGLRGQAEDTWVVGYNWRMGRRLSFSLLAMRRSLVRTIQAGLDTLSVYIYGNPGYGAMAQFPRAKRVYDAVEATLESTGDDSRWFRVSYVLSRTRGNDPGLYGSDWRLGFTNFGPLWILPEQVATGLLPNDRTHVMKAIGSQQFSRLTLGASLLVASGTPLSEYGGISIPPPFRGFASPRGTSGRTPTIWDLGIRASYNLPVGGSADFRARVVLDLQHLGSPRKVVDRDQWHYTCLDQNGNQSCPNAGYGRVLQYQSPMVARVGVLVDLGGKP